LGEKIVADLDRIACRGRTPDLTLWLDINIETSLERARHRNTRQSSAATRMDEQSPAFYKRVLEGYRLLAEREPDRFIRVDGDGTVEQVAARVWEAYSRWENGHV
jgi:dTMP kinase